MIIFREGERLSAWLRREKSMGKTIGFVPTMGALHEGHLDLVQRSGTNTDISVCSIFVNPTQFNDPRDFEKYPVTIDRDIHLLTALDLHALYLPSVADIYPQGTASLPTFDLGYLETILEGHYRPGHFQGVCQVVSRLLQIVQPDMLFMGRKDYQQCMVVRKLLELTSSPVELVTCETVREPDGLAMSSRNMRLTPGERARAPLIHEVLCQVGQDLRPGPLLHLTDRAKQQLGDNGFKVDYVEICEADTLRPLTHWDGKTPLVALVAAFNGPVRLIDNLQISF